jgi:hypothetical protein
VPNQLAQYGQLAQIQNAQNQNALAQFQLASAQRGEEQQSNFYREAQLPGFTLDAATAMRYGAPGMAALKAQQEAQEQELKRQKLTGEIKAQAAKEIDSALSLFTKAVPGIMTPQQVENFTRAQYRHPVIGKIAGMFKTEDAAVADALNQVSTPQGLSQWKISNAGITGDKLIDLMKTTLEKTDFGGTIREQMRDWSGAPVGAPVSTPKTPLPADVEAQNLRRAAAGATRVSVDTGKKYGEAVAAGAGADDLKLFAQARQIPQDIEKIDQTLNILKKSDINTGLGAEVFTILDRARTQFAADKKAGARVTSTEYLDSLLGAAVFPQIHALGIGARGMDTPAEREFLRKVMTGSITLNKDTLIKMTELRRNMLEDQAKQFNARVDSGELTRFFEAAGRKPMKVNVPAYSSGDIQSQADAILNRR